MFVLILYLCLKNISKALFVSHFVKFKVILRKFDFGDFLKIFGNLIYLLYIKKFYNYFIFFAVKTMFVLKNNLF